MTLRKRLDEFKGGETHPYFCALQIHRKVHKNA